MEKNLMNITREDIEFPPTFPKKLIDIFKANWRNTENPPPLNDKEKELVDAKEWGKAYWTYVRRNWTFGGATMKAINKYVKSKGGTDE
jgi:hypothetical protein